MVVMSKTVKTFEVIFSDPSKTFYCSGDKVAGKILVEVAEVTRVSAMKVLGVGCAKVEYAKGKQKCREENEYLRYEEVVQLDDHPADHDGSVILRPGNKYEYMFGFELPQQGQIVSSYKGKFGYVQYYVKAFMERPAQPALECKKHFEVEEPLDVNTPDLLSPTGGMKEKKVTCMFIPDGQVSLNAKIDRKGFCEGEDICICAKFENTCSRIVIPKAAIISKHTYQANGRTKVFRQKLSSVRGNHIISGMCDAWQGKTIRVPKIKPSMLGCNIIRVEYALMIYMHIPGSEKLILELPLVIGTAGLGSRTNSMSSTDGSVSNASASWVSLRMPSAPPSYCDVTRDCRLDQPLTPLLNDYDGDDSPIFMHASAFQFPNLPAYSEVDEEFSGNAHMLQVC
ncbi:thioredoxin-interacting protein [Salmo salar]|uniref:Thioredoxin-interacting protein n=2 Tax=Salmo TaxID=8028 RepID=C0H9E8_SALSA|nr:thioredoxin-interacting protein [Salmo salar]XP_029591165.1 thioredoxin-interacting protein-like [Salmo trutta]ACN10667.1 Thioredoxin-interacting protein [Salmo salar]|eukprot:XP_013997753.1 PREDICTED: thioredoxin-interacting protein-like [Salmo salar]